MKTWLPSGRSERQKTQRFSSRRNEKMVCLFLELLAQISFPSMIQEPSHFVLRFHVSHKLCTGRSEQRGRRLVRHDWHMPNRCCFALWLKSGYRSCTRNCSRLWITMPVLLNDTCEELGWFAVVFLSLKRCLLFLWLSLEVLCRLLWDQLHVLRTKASYQLRSHMVHRLTYCIGSLTKTYGTLFQRDLATSLPRVLTGMQPKWHKMAPQNSQIFEPFQLMERKIQRSSFEWTELEGLTHHVSVFSSQNEVSI